MAARGTARVAFGLTVTLLVVAGCGAARPATGPAQPSWLHATLGFAPSPPLARRYETVELRLTSPSGRPLEGARLIWNADMIGMNHPAPATLAEAGGGYYEGRTLFVMGGAWRATVRVALDGRTATLSFPFAVRD